MAILTDHKSYTYTVMLHKSSQRETKHQIHVDHFQDIPIDTTIFVSQTTEITHFAVVFHSVLRACDL